MASIERSSSSVLTTLAFVEDNDDLREEMCFRLEREGYRVLACRDGIELDRVLKEEAQCRLVVLDRGLPGEDGLSIAMRLRRDHPGLGIVMLTARGRLTERVEGLAGGADAYLVKPVDFLEFVVVIESVLRRLASPEPTAAAGDWLLRFAALELVSPAGKVISLTGTEMRLLRELARAGGEPVERRRLVEALGEDFWQFDARRLDTAMSRLRSKLDEECDLTASPIKAVRNVGYVLAIPIREVAASGPLPA